MPNKKAIIVEYAATVRFQVDMIDDLIVTAGLGEASLGEPVAFYNDQGEPLVPALVPPKFASLDEADAWLEAHPVQTGFSEDPALLEHAHGVASKVDISDWF